MNVHPETERIELRLLLEAIHLKYGYDFRNYPKLTSSGASSTA